ncbi:hypothetical protein SMD11_1208 [Streptomyces albireticuli]|uniref:Uncharacterized protein n=1 Tax=Streptomyces albireticuli TaxID=1940 RepID=A0A1Z2KXV9_9ACTN|nr:hypothetical protein [Streptomyces albireticuli]ARZ66869.1 hypothetical protein SMD11_1208 [Streptomyces albireticuli]
MTEYEYEIPRRGQVPNKIDARARAHLGAQGKLICKVCHSRRVSVHDQGTLGVLIMCEEDSCQAAHTIFRS